MQSCTSYLLSWAGLKWYHDKFFQRNAITWFLILYKLLSWLENNHQIKKLQCIAELKFANKYQSISIYQFLELLSRSHIFWFYIRVTSTVWKSFNRFVSVQEMPRYLCVFPYSETFLVFLFRLRRLDQWSAPECRSVWRPFPEHTVAPVVTNVSVIG